MKLFNRKCIAFLAVAVALFAVVTCGGCGGSHDDNITDGGGGEVYDADAVLSGGWRVDTSANNTLSADIDGETVNFAVIDFALKFSSVDVESLTGSTYFEAVAVISGEKGLFPLAYDLTSADTVNSMSRSNQWLVSAQNTVLEVTLNNAVSNPVINISGTVKIIGDIYAAIDVTLKKVNETQKTESEMNASVNGNWLSVSDVLTGGFYFVSMDAVSTPGTPYIEGLMMHGLNEIDVLYTSAKFANTSIADGSTTLSNMNLLVFFNDDASRDWSGNELLQPLVYEDTEVKISHVFNDVYKIAGYPSEKSTLMINGDRAYLINSVSQVSGDAIAEYNVLYALEKKPDTSSVNISDYIGTAWDKTFATGQTANFTISTPDVKEMKFESLSLAFTGGLADIADGRMTALITAKYAEADNSGTSTEIKTINTAIDLKNIKQIAYNTWYAIDETSGADFAFTVFDTDDNSAPSALVFTNIYSGLLGAEYISIAALMSETGDMSDVFFSGGWRWRRGNKVDVKFVASNDTSRPIDANVFHFGAYFTSVDIDAGSANFSAVCVLSIDDAPFSDTIVPIVFDSVPVNVAAGSEPGEYSISTENGSTFTVQMLSPDADGAMHANISGVINYSVLGFNVSLDAEVTKADKSKEAATIEFDSVMRDSTWQTTLADSANSGGFVVMPNVSQLPFVSSLPGRTMASLSFRGDSSNAAATGFGVMNTSAGVMPVTMINLPVSTQHMFNNYYRFDFVSGDAGIKGVCVLESDTKLRLIFEAANTISSSPIRMHTLLSLTKLDIGSEQDLREWIDTTWTSEHMGGFFISGDAVMRFSDNTEQGTELLLDDFTVSFGQPSGERTIDFDAVINLHSADGSRSLSLPFTGKIDAYDAGENMWYGITQENHSNFVLTAIKDETGEGWHVIVSANLKIERGGRYFHVSVAGTMTKVY